jgi:hypothetical protein
LSANSFAVIGNPVAEPKHKFPEGNLNVTPCGVSLIEVHSARLPLQVVKDIHKLTVRLSCLGPAHVLEPGISFVVAVERPMVLVETTQSHSLTVVHLDGFHMQVFKGLFVNDGPVVLEALKNV